MSRPNAPGRADAEANLRARTLTRLRILIVDDEDDGREVLQMMLDANGAEVVAVSSAAEAIEAIGARPFDLLLADIGMPDRDGYSLIEEVRELPKGKGGDLLAIAVTAYGGPRERQQALAAGYQAHMPKPVDFDTLIRVIADVLAAREAERRS